MKFLTFKTEADYSKIHFLPFNRECRYRQDLVDSMNEFGFQGAIELIETDLILGKKEMYVYEGQHRFLTATRLKIPFYGLLCDHQFKDIPELVKFIATKNSTQSKWTPTNYIRVYSYLNFQDYKTLTQIKSTCPYTLTTVAAMLHGFRSRTMISRHLENGTFKCNLIEATKYTLDLALKLSKYGVMSSRMVTALHYVASLKDFDEAKFIKQYIKNYKCIKELRLDDYSDVFASWLA